MYVCSSICPGTPQPSLTAAKVAGTPSINYGVFLQCTFDFIIIAFVMFIK
jgi:large conductance mechanosensitive channel